MIALFVNSRLEIWSAQYINHPEKREGEDKNARVVQIEPSGTKDFFMVEVIMEEDSCGG